MSIYTLFTINFSNKDKNIKSHQDHILATFSCYCCYCCYCFVNITFCPLLTMGFGEISMSTSLKLPVYLIVAR